MMDQEAYFPHYCKDNCDKKKNIEVYHKHADNEENAR